ncbi:MAG: glycosyltransferase family 39 protein [Phycisphaerae bacterium]|jgi:4-amino-4-deoxy-L-arabinose transferase-like glycosyltransferase
MNCQTNSAALENACLPSLRRHSKIILFIILLLAAFLRLVNLGQSPPGLNQDEAANAWSAYCLLKTGNDYTGASWPIYYMRSLGGNSSTLLTYMMIPFQAIGGLNVYTTRLPAVFAGVFTVWLIYFVAKKLFDTETGLAAAALLALNPWHLQQSRWGHEASIAPLLGLVPLAVMLWANLPVGDDKNNSPRPLIAGIGGVLAGVGCFGYHSIRIFVPVLILAAVLFNLPGWWKTIKTRKGALSVALFVLGFAATFGQLLYQHIFNPEGIGRHAYFQTDWVGSASLVDSLKNVPLRYIQHFGADFLFLRGDHYAIQGPPVGGQFHWYALPLMISGAILVLRKFKTSASLRTLAAFVLTYPIGDCLGWNLLSTHALRSAPGLCALVLLSAAGFTAAVRWLWKQNHSIAWATIMVFMASVIALNARFFYHFYGEFNRRPEIYHMFHVDLIEACDWLKPRFDDFDAVYITTEGFITPYVITTVAIGYDPQKWFSEPHEFTAPEEWDIYTRYGKLYFMYKDYFKRPDTKFLPDRTLFIIRPDETPIENTPLKVIREIVRPDGVVVLLICRL